MKYNEWLNEWLEYYVKPTSKQKTYQRYREIVASHVTEKLGDMELSEITPIILQKFITELSYSGNLKTGKGLAPNSVNLSIAVIQNSLKCAYSIGQITEYTASKIKRPRIKEKQITCFTKAEQRKIEQAILNGKKKKMYGVLICLYTGLRIGELLALEWGDVDLRKELIYVRKTCCDGKDGNGNFTRITCSPKTDSSERCVPVPKQLISVLKVMKKSGIPPYVVSSYSGKPLYVRAYQRSFQLLLKRLNIERKGFHSLRHTFATRALECGMDVKTLSEILGHKSATVTLNKYAHSMQEHKKAMMNKLGKMLL